MTVPRAGHTPVVAERTMDQWWRMTVRWAVAGAVAGVVVALWFAVTDPGGSVVGLASFVPLCAALAVLLRHCVYRYDYVRVWGWRALGLFVAVWAGLTALGVAGTCAADACGG